MMTGYCLHFIPANTRPIKRSVSLGSTKKISRLPTVILYFAQQRNSRCVLNILQINFSILAHELFGLFCFLFAYMIVDIDNCSKSFLLWIIFYLSTANDAILMVIFTENQRICELSRYMTIYSSPVA